MQMDILWVLIRCAVLAIYNSHFLLRVPVCAASIQLHQSSLKGDLPPYFSTHSIVVFIHPPDACWLGLVFYGFLRLLDSLVWYHIYSNCTIYIHCHDRVVIFWNVLQLLLIYSLEIMMTIQSYKIVYTLNKLLLTKHKIISLPILQYIFMLNILQYSSKQ